MEDEQKLLTIVELESYLKSKERTWTEEENDEFLEFIASRPYAGTVLRGSGGVRKVRYQREGTGKSGGVRVFYYFLNREDLIFLILVYSKTQKDSLTQSQTNQLNKLSKELQHYGAQDD